MVVASEGGSLVTDAVMSRGVDRLAFVVDEPPGQGILCLCREEVPGEGAQRMLRTENLEVLKEQVAGYPEPTLSVYLNVNPANAENRGKAYVIRLKDALKEHGVLKVLAERVLDYAEAEQPRMRTLVLFATPDGPFEVYWLRTELPEEVRWGEPYVAPLELAIDEYEPTGVALLDAKRFRFLLTSLGEIEEELKAANVFSTAGWREVTISPSMAHPGSGTAKDLFERRLEEWTRRFYKEVGEELRRLVEKFEVGRLILAGPDERTVAFSSALPRGIRELVAVRVHLPLGTPEGEVIKRISEVAEQLEREQEKQLLAEVGERGVRDLEATLRALAEGRVYLLAAPWPLSGEVRWCDSCALASAAQAREEKDCPYCGAPTRRRFLADALVELATTRGARIEFVRGENADALRRDFGGLAGLTRF
jgi:hypothetical protein